MQSTTISRERITLWAMDKAIEAVKDCSAIRYGTAEEKQQMRDVIAFLLRPSRAIIVQMAAAGLSKVEKSPADIARALAAQGGQKLVAGSKQVRALQQAADAAWKETHDDDQSDRQAEDAG